MMAKQTELHMKSNSRYHTDQLYAAFISERQKIRYHTENNETIDRLKDVNQFLVTNLEKVGKDIEELRGLKKEVETLKKENRSLKNRLVKQDQSHGKKIQSMKGSLEKVAKENEKTLRIFIVILSLFVGVVCVLCVVFYREKESMRTITVDIQNLTESLNMLKGGSQRLDEEILKLLASKEFVREARKGLNKEIIDCRRDFGAVKLLASKDYVRKAIKGVVNKEMIDFKRKFGAASLVGNKGKVSQSAWNDTEKWAKEVVDLTNTVNMVIKENQSLKKNLRTLEVKFVVIEETLKGKNLKENEEELTKLTGEEVFDQKKQVAKVAIPNSEKASKDKQNTQEPFSKTHVFWRYFWVLEYWLCVLFLMSHVTLSCFGLLDQIYDSTLRKFHKPNDTLDFFMILGLLIGALHCLHLLLWEQNVEKTTHEQMSKIQLIWWYLCVLEYWFCVLYLVCIFITLCMEMKPPDIGTWRTEIYPFVFGIIMLIYFVRCWFILVTPKAHF